MKQLKIIILLIAVYSLIYFWSVGHSTEGELGVLCFLLLPLLLSIGAFERKKIGLCFLMSGVLLLALRILLPRGLFGLDDIYLVMGVEFVPIGVIMGTIERVTAWSFPMKTAWQTIITSLCIVVLTGVVAEIGFFGYAQYLTDPARAKIITERAVLANDSSICDSIRPPFMEPDPTDDCYVAVAVGNHNMRACKALPGCLTRYFTALQLRDFTACTTFTNLQERDDCYFEQFLAMKDPAICKLFQDPYKKQLCENNTAQP